MHLKLQSIEIWNTLENKLKSHIQDKLPEENQKCMVGINQVLKISWAIVHNDSTNNNNMLQALVLINDWPRTPVE
jgi:hypothetical protein